MVPLDSRITRYLHFASTLSNSLEKLSKELDYRLEKEQQIEDLKSAFEERLGQYITEAYTDALTGISNRRAMVNYMV